MKFRKFFGVFIIIIFVCTMLAVNVFALGSQHHEWRSSGAAETAKFNVTGSTITQNITNSRVNIAIDANTSSRTIQVKVQYWTPGFLGLTGIAYDQTLYKGNLGTGSSSTSYNYGTAASYTYYNAKNNGSLRSIADGANSAYYFKYDFTVSGAS